MIPNPIIPSEPMRGAVNKTSEPYAHAYSWRFIGSDVWNFSIRKGEAPVNPDVEFKDVQPLYATVPEPQPEAAAEPVATGPLTLREEVEMSRTTLIRYCLLAQAGQYPADAREFERRADAAFRNIRAMLATPPVVEEAVKAEPIHQQFRLKWDAAPRPPAHPYVMHGHHTFPSFATALAFMMQQPDDSAFVSLMQIDSYETDRSDDLRSARSATP